MAGPKLRRAIFNSENGAKIAPTENGAKIAPTENGAKIAPTENCANSNQAYQLTLRVRIDLLTALDPYI